MKTQNTIQDLNIQKRNELAQKIVELQAQIDVLKLSHDFVISFENDEKQRKHNDEMYRLNHELKLARHQYKQIIL